MVVNDSIVEDFELELPFTDPKEEQGKADNLDPVALGGDRFDKGGNLIKDNKIIKTKEEIEASVTKTEESKKETFDVEDTKKEDPKNEVEEKYEIDKDGNLIKDGAIFKKKGEFKINDAGEVSLETKGFVDSLIDLAKTQGYNFVDEEGNQLEFEDSDSGYFALTQSIAEQEAVKNINTFLETYDPVKELYIHLQAGGKAEDFYSKKASLIDYSNIAQPTEDTQRESLVMDLFRKVYNMPEDKAKEMTTLIKDSNNLEAKSIEALAELSNWQKKATEDERAANQALIKAQQEEQSKTLKAINTTIINGKLGEIEIPAKERNDFYTYLTQEIKPGVTKSTESYEKLSLDQQLMIDYLVYKGMSLEDLVKVKLQTAKADLIKNRAGQLKPIIVSTKFSANQGQMPTDADDVK